MTDKEACKIVQALIEKSGKSQTQISNELKWTQSNFSRKIRTGTLRLGEALTVFENLGYEIELKKKGEPFALKIEGGK